MSLCNGIYNFTNKSLERRAAKLCIKRRIFYVKPKDALHITLDIKYCMVPTWPHNQTSLYKFSLQLAHLCEFEETFGGR